MVSNTSLGGSGLVVSAFAGSNAELDPGETPQTPVMATVKIFNSGVVRSSGGALLDLVSPCCNFPPPPGAPVIRLTTGVGGYAEGTGGSHVSITNQAGAIIEANGPLRLGNAFPFGGPIAGHPVLVGGPSGFGSIALTAYGSVVEITNNGTISGGVGGEFSEGTRVSINWGENIGENVNVDDLFPSPPVNFQHHLIIRPDSVARRSRVWGLVGPLRDIVASIAARL